MKQIISFILSAFVLFGVFCVCSAGEKGAAKAEGLVRINVEDEKVLDTVKDAREIGKTNKILSVKIRIDYAGNEPVKIPVDKIIMKTNSGNKCELFGIGSALKGFDSFNVYLPFKVPWTPFSMKYKENDGEKELFGLKQDSLTNPLIITFYQKDKTILIGFVIPVGKTSFKLNVGNSNVVKVVAK